MSIDAAVGRIDQILTLRQQVADPATFAAGTGSTASTPGTATGAATGAGGSGSSADFSSLLAGAQAQAATATPGLMSTTALGAPSPAAGRVTSMVQQADALVGEPYVWGGGHGGWAPRVGYDCSGFVSKVLHAGGYLSSPADTVSLPGQAGMLQGPGQYVTVYDRTGAGENGHVMIDLNGQFYESGGGSGAWGGGGGVAKIGTPTPQYLATFDTVLHPAGL